MFKRFIYIFLIIFILSCNKFNKNDIKNYKIEKSEFYLLTGNISGEKASMYFYINQDKNIVSGYYYTKSKKSIIEGSINNKKLKLKESDENNNIIASIVGEFNDKKQLNAEITYNKNSEVQDMSFELNRDVQVHYADIIDYYKNENINNSIFSYHKTSLFFSKDNDTKFSEIDNTINYLKEECDNYYNEWKTIIADGFTNVIYEIDNTINVGYIDNRIIALDNYSYYADEFHNIKANIQEVFSLESSNLITIRELINNFNDPKLINIMREKILNSGNSKESYFDFYNITLENSTFKILPNSINFIWQLYDIAPYSTGITEINFSFDELKPFIKKESYLYYLFM